jgi:hypothetical protein
MAAACTLDFLENLLAIKPLAERELNIYLVPAPAWAILTGVFLMRLKT